MYLPSVAGGPIGPARLLVGAAALTLAATAPSLAAGPQVFPVKSAFVPVVVAAAFIMPALVAGTWSSMKRSAGRMAPALAVALAIGLAAGVTAYARPDLLSVLRI